MRLTDLPRYRGNLATKVFDLFRAGKQAQIKFCRNSHNNTSHTICIS